MSNKSEATWHPNGGPGDDYAELRGRLDALLDESPETEAWERPLLNGHPSYADRLHAVVTEVLAALDELVPRTRTISAEDVDAYFVKEGIHTYREVLQLGEDSDAAAEKAERERDAIAHVMEQVRAVVVDALANADDSGVGWDAEVSASVLHEILDAAPPVSLVRHDAEVKAQALIEAAREYECRNQWTPTLYTRTWLEDRAAAMRAEAE